MFYEAKQQFFRFFCMFTCFFCIFNAYADEFKQSDYSPVPLKELQDNPEQYVGKKVSFKAIFHGVGITFDPEVKNPTRDTQKYYLLKNPSLVIPKKTERSENSLIEKQLQEIIIDKIDFQELPAEKVFEFIAQKSKELDPKKQGFDIVFKSDGLDESDLIITMVVEDIPIGDAIYYTCHAIDCSFQINKNSIIIEKNPKDKPIEKNSVIKKTFIIDSRCLPKKRKFIPYLTLICPFIKNNVFSGDFDISYDEDSRMLTMIGEEKSILEGLEHLEREFQVFDIKIGGQLPILIKRNSDWRYYLHQYTENESELEIFGEIKKGQVHGKRQFWFLVDRIIDMSSQTKDMSDWRKNYNKAQEEAERKKTKLNRVLNETVLQEVDIKDATIFDVCDFLRRKLKKYNCGASAFWFKACGSLEEYKKRKASFKLRNVVLRDFIEIVAVEYNLDYNCYEDFVNFRPESNVGCNYGGILIDLPIVAVKDPEKLAHKSTSMVYCFEIEKLMANGSEFSLYVMKWVDAIYPFEVDDE